MTPLSDTRVDRLTSAIWDADQRPRVFHRRYHRDLGDTALPTGCAYCLAALDTNATGQHRITYLVPLALGGPADPDNRVFSCLSCARSKGPKDLVAWKTFQRLGNESSRSLLLKQRRAVLQHAPNHLTPTRAGASSEQVLAALDKRWIHPRFTVYAVHGTDAAFIGWTSGNGTGSAHGLASVLLRFGSRAVQRAAGKVVLYELPADAFLDAVWFLIDHHALVHAIQNHGLETWPRDPDNWQHHWDVQLEDVSDLRRRRARQPGNNARTPGTRAHAEHRWIRDGIPIPAHLDSILPPPAPVPHPPRPLSTSKAAVAQRKRYASKARHRREQTYLEARASLDAFKEDVRQGRIVAPPVQVIEAMEREVLALLP